MEAVAVGGCERWCSKYTGRDEVDGERLKLL